MSMPTLTVRSQIMDAATDMGSELAQRCRSFRCAARRLFGRVAVSGTLAFCLLGAHGQAAHFAGQQTVIATGFTDPFGVAVDTSGNVYMSDFSAGTIYKETYVNGVYTQSTLFTGLNYPAGLAIDARGNLYVAEGGGDVLKETLSSGVYTATVVDKNLQSPFGVAVDPAGNVYIASHTGTVLKETYAAGVYTRSTIGTGFGYLFELIVDPSGDVLFPDQDANHIVKETPSGAAYTQSFLTITGLNGPTDVAEDVAGNLYITDANGSSLDEAVFNGTSYARKSLATVNLPQGLAMDTHGNFYYSSVTYNSGVTQGSLYKFTRSPDLGHVPVGTAATPMAIQFTIDSTGVLGSPVVLTQGLPGLDFTLGTGSTCTGVLTAGSTCTVNVAFKPTSTGLRSGAVEITNSLGVVIATAFVQGDGIGPQAKFTPGKIVTVAGNGTPGNTGDGGAATSAEFNGPTLVVADQSGNLYIADPIARVIRKVTAGTGTISTIAGTGANGDTGDGGPATSATFEQISGLALDGAGNIYIADQFTYRVRKITASTGIISNFAGIGSSGSDGGDGGPASSATLNFPFDLAVDGAGNVFILDVCAVREVFAGSGTITTVAGKLDCKSEYTGDGIAATNSELNDPFGVAVDQVGNLYIGDADNERVRKVTATTGLISTIAGTGVSGFSGDGGQATSAVLNTPTKVAVDSAGNVYFQDEANNRLRRISAATGIISTIAGNGTAGFTGDGGASTKSELGPAVGIAFDAAGNLFFADYGNFRVREITATAAPVTFASTPVGSISTDSPQTVTVNNTGNADLLFPAPTMAGAQNPSLTVDFPYGNTSTCPQLSTTSSSYVLSSGGSCTEVISFMPTTSGAISGSSVSTDNNLNNAGSTQTVPLMGTGTGTTTTTTLALNPSSNVAQGSTVNLTATISPSAATGTVTFYNNGMAISGGVMVTGGTAMFAVTNIASGSYSFTAIFTGSGGYLTSMSSAKTLTVQQTQTITFPQPATPVTYAAGATATLTATSTSGLAVTYSVTSGPATVSGSTLTYTGAGTVVVEADQSGNATYAAASPVSRTIVVNPAAPAITFSVPDHAYGDAPFTVNATSNSGGAFTYTVVSGPATISGNTVTLTGAGSVTLQAAQAAAGNYTSGKQNATFNVTAGAPTIAFSVPNHTYGDAPFTVSASSNSGGAFTYTVVSGPATISGNTVTLTGAGTVMLQASQAASGNYRDGTQTTSFSVMSASPTITFSVPNHTFGDAPFTVTAMSNSGGAFSYSVKSGPATVNGNTVTLTGAGSVVLQASEAAAGNYSSGNQTASFAVAAIAPTLSFIVTNHVYGDPVFNVNATSNSAGGFTYSVISGPATVTGNAVTLTGVGQVTLLASQAAAGNYLSGQMQASFTVAAQDFSFTATGAPSQTGALGSTLTYTFALAPGYGVYPGVVNFSLLGALPSGAEYSFSPASVAPDGGAQTVTLTVRTLSLQGANSATPSARNVAPISLAVLLLPLLGLGCRRRKLVRLTALCLLTIVGGGLAAVVLQGCGSGVRPADYPVTVTATSAGFHHIASVSVDVH